MQAICTPIIAMECLVVVASIARKRNLKGTIPKLALYVIFLTTNMQQISTLFREIAPQKKQSERGSLLEYFAGKLHKKIPYVAFKLTGMDLSTLYFIKSSCDQAENRGIPWGAAFYSSIKVK